MDSNFTFGASNQTINIIFDFIGACEICLIVASCVANGFFIYIIIKVPIVHRNLIRLFNSMYMASIVASLARIMINIGKLTRLDTGVQDTLTPDRLKTPVFGFCELIRFYSLMHVLTVMGCIVFERTLATIKLKSYENWTTDWFFVCLAFIQLIASTIATAVLYTGFLNILIFGIGLIIFALIGGGIPFILDRINKKRYRNAKKCSTTYTLSERYQLAENIRVMKIMKRTIIVLIILNLTIFPAFILIYFAKNEFLRRISIVLLNYLIVAYEIIFPIVAITSTDIWKRQINLEYYKFMRFLRSSKVNTDEEPILNLKTCDGRRMTFSLDEERDIYFNQLYKEWN